MIPHLAWLQSMDQARLWADTFLIWSLVSYVRNDNTLKLNTGFPGPGDGDRIGVDVVCSTLGGMAGAVWSLQSGCPWILAESSSLQACCFPS